MSQSVRRSFRVDVHSPDSIEIIHSESPRSLYADGAHVGVLIVIVCILEAAIPAWPFGALTLTAALVMMALKAFQIDEESVVAVRGVGIELRVRQRHGALRSHFIPAKDIADVIIAEGVTYSDAFYFLAIRIHSSKELQVPFQRLRPSRPLLVWSLKSLRALCLEDGQVPELYGKQEAAELESGGTTIQSTQGLSKRR
eukprot:gnl/MRDRNA2_/MRDRNA2_195152_c0_seq1.p1 gnl/MRDRNA2_/MRDRNA2_195152_c0~~gnl/MRDRNA2_/MRDRNA2_195152_c0_seq1.p1  ORF type:complete len:198 (-),score=31.18 gnl/MRDRNA2_/MRDRNA2_195152_c0_seq1:136-729(-)